MPSPQACCEVESDVGGERVISQPSGVAGVHDGFSGDLVITSANCKLCVWDGVTGKQRFSGRQGGLPGEVTARFLDADHLLLSRVSSPLTQWDLRTQTGHTVAGSVSHASVVCALGEEWLVWNGYRSKAPCPLHVTSRETGETVMQQVPRDEEMYRFLSVMVDGERVVGVGLGGLMCVWDGDTGAVLNQIHLEVDGERPGLSRVWRLPDGRIAVLRAMPAVLWIVASDLSEVSVHKMGRILWYPVVREDGAVLVARADAERVVVISLPECKIVTSYTPSAKVAALAIQGETVAIGIRDGVVATFALRW